MEKVYKAKIKREICAGIFAFSLLAFLAGSAGLIVANINPVILGSEMNANGSVEYLCLGRACESYPFMSW